ncbi:MAG TPA: cob(I)yrinic acid a,c-diamide adenosyltransferase [Caulobacteraceae bacterium]|jgi:cob(I)alamin adenosyltransferase
MVVLNRIYTRTGDGGETGLATGERIRKNHPRLAAVGSVDETNAAIGVARLEAASEPLLDGLLARIQNELFDLGADLATPRETVAWRKLWIEPAQVERLEAEIDQLNADLPALDSFVLPGGSRLAAGLHMARTVCRRAEREAFALAETGEVVRAPALKYLNRLSDLLFVAARFANARSGDGDIKWVAGAGREPAP